jgi:F-box and WD-40 domain protein CDC4
LSNALNLPASPPTPAPSPIPREDAPLVLPSWQAAHVDEDDFLRRVRTHYITLGTAERQRFLAEILNISETEELRFVNAFVRPRLKVDFLKMLPMEVGLRVCFLFF